MTDVIAFTGAPARPFDFTSKEAHARVRRRYRAETRFRAYGIAALAITTVFVIVLVADILVKGLPAFVQHSLVLDVAIPADAFGPQRSAEEIKSADYFPVTRDALKAAIPGCRGPGRRAHVDAPPQYRCCRRSFGTDWSPIPR